MAQKAKTVKKRRRAPKQKPVSPSAPMDWVLLGYISVMVVTALVITAVALFRSAW